MKNFEKGGSILKNVAPKIYQEKTYSGTEHMRSANLYLVHGSPRSLLIDAGYNNQDSQEIVLAMLRELEISPQELDVFVTHNHPDHAGLALFLSEQGARIFMKREERDTCAIICTYYAQERSASMARLHRYGFTQVQAERILERVFTPDYQYHAYNWTDFPVIDVAEGAHFRYGDYDFEVIGLPGHTKYQVGLVERTHKWLFAGDTLSRNEVLIISSMTTGDNLLQMHLQTLDRLAAAYPDFWVVPGHYNPFYGTEKSVANTKRYFAHITERIHKTIQSAGQPLSLANIVELVFRYKPGRMEEEESLKLHFRISNTLACLEMLVSEGKLQLCPDGERWQWKTTEEAE